MAETMGDWLHIASLDDMEQAGAVVPGQHKHNVRVMMTAVPEPTPIDDDEAYLFFQQALRNGVTQEGCTFLVVMVRPGRLESLEAYLRHYLKTTVDWMQLLLNWVKEQPKGAAGLLIMRPNVGGKE